MQKATPTLLFVYGTLRPQLIGRATTSPPRSLVYGLISAGPATVPGLLIDLGAYPGFVPASACEQPEGSGVGSTSAVIGDLLEVNEQQLLVLDDYEECGGDDPLYVRDVITATRQSDGRQLLCWIYRYCRDIGGAEAIDSGDYAEHLRNKS